MSSNNPNNPTQCYCTIVAKESSAMLTNIVLEATLDLSVLERIKLDVPMKTDCYVNSVSQNGQNISVSK